MVSPPHFDHEELDVYQLKSNMAFPLLRALGASVVKFLC
jgi:hypothetical protein